MNSQCRCFLIFLTASAGYFAAPFFAADLPQKQEQLAQRYAHLETILQRLAEASKSANPKNAELLQKVLTESKDKLLAVRLDIITDALKNRKLNDAVTEQQKAEADLAMLLDILESADRALKRNNEQEKLKEALRELAEIATRQRGLMSKEQNGQQNGKSLSEEQKEIRNKTETLKETLEAGNAADNELQRAAKALLDAAQNMQKAEEKLQKSDKNSSDKNNEAGENGKSGESGKSGENEKSGESGKSGKGGKSGQSGAAEHQEDALADIMKAKAELEKMLKQLREEEQMQMLEKLEERFKRMLQIELGIQTKTISLPQTATLNREQQIACSQLAADQLTALEEGSVALLMLQEDGTARGTAETLEQAMSDMLTVQQQFEKQQINPLTLTALEFIIQALKDLIDAVQESKEALQEKMDASKNGSSAGGDENEPLIQMLSELRMIRTMQRRVNDRTAFCEREIDALRSTGTMLPANPYYTILGVQVLDLARQQSRIKHILDGIKTGKTK